jgi:hypothetical protein
MAEDMLLRLLPWASILAAADTPDSITRAGRHGIAAHPALASGNLFNIDH